MDALCYKFVPETLRRTIPETSSWTRSEMVLLGGEGRDFAEKGEGHPAAHASETQFHARVVPGRVVADEYL